MTDYGTLRFLSGYRGEIHYRHPAPAPTAGPRWSPTYAVLSVVADQARRVHVTPCQADADLVRAHHAKVRDTLEAKYGPITPSDSTLGMYAWPVIADYDAWARHVYPSHQHADDDTIRADAECWNANRDRAIGDGARAALRPRTFIGPLHPCQIREMTDRLTRHARYVPGVGIVRPAVDLPTAADLLTTR